jgi:hypothetical protein
LRVTTYLSFAEKLSNLKGPVPTAALPDAKSGGSASFAAFAETTKTFDSIPGREGIGRSVRKRTVCRSTASVAVTPRMLFV